MVLDRYILVNWTEPVDNGCPITQYTYQMTTSSSDETTCTGCDNSYDSGGGAACLYAGASDCWLYKRYLCADGGDRQDTDAYGGTSNLAATTADECAEPAVGTKADGSQQGEVT